MYDLVPEEVAPATSLGDIDKLLELLAQQTARVLELMARRDSLRTLDLGPPWLNSGLLLIVGGVSAFILYVLEYIKVLPSSFLNPVGVWLLVACAALGFVLRERTHLRTKVSTDLLQSELMMAAARLERVARFVDLIDLSEFKDLSTRLRVELGLADAQAALRLAGYDTTAHYGESESPTSDASAPSIQRVGRA